MPYYGTIVSFFSSHSTAKVSLPLMYWASDHLSVISQLSVVNFNLAFSPDTVLVTEFQHGPRILLNVPLSKVKVTQGPKKLFLKYYFQLKGKLSTEISADKTFVCMPIWMTLLTVQEL